MILQTRGTEVEEVTKVVETKVTVTFVFTEEMLKDVTPIAINGKAQFTAKELLEFLTSEDEFEATVIKAHLHLNEEQILQTVKQKALQSGKSLKPDAAIRELIRGLK